MQTLPLEITTAIFRFVKKADLKSLRLVSRRLNDVASPMLFMSVAVSRDKDIEVLKCIAGDLVIRWLVQEVIYSDADCDHADFGRSYWLFPTDGSLQCVHVRGDRGGTHKTMGYYVHVRAIISALLKMPNVRRVIFNHEDHYPPPPPEDPFGYYYLYCTAIYTPPGSQHDSRAEEDPDVCPDEGLFIASEYFNELIHQAMPEKFICHAISVTKVYAARQSSCSSQSDFTRICKRYCPTAFSLMSPNEIHLAGMTFGSLREISLQLSFYRLLKENSNINFKYYSDKNRLLKILAAAKNLEVLKLDFDETNRSVMLPLKAYLGSITWPRLQSIHLRRKNFENGEELTDMVYRHLQTLRSLCLKDIWLVNGHWWTWAQQIRARISYGTPLERIELSGLQCGLDGDKHSIASHCLESYLLRGSHDRGCTCEYSSCT
jgi:F-box-like